MYEPAEASAAVQQGRRGRSALMARAKCPRGSVPGLLKVWGRKPPSGKESDPPRGCRLAGGRATRGTLEKPGRRTVAGDGSIFSSG